MELILFVFCYHASNAFNLFIRKSRMLADEPANECF